MKKPKGEKIKEIVVEDGNKKVTWGVYKELYKGVETVTLYQENVYSKPKKDKKRSNS